MSESDNIPQLLTRQDVARILQCTLDAAGNVHTHAIEFEAYGEAQSASRTMLFREWDEYGIKPVAVCSGVTNGHGKFRESIHDD